MQSKDKLPFSYLYHKKFSGQKLEDSKNDKLTTNIPIPKDRKIDIPEEFFDYIFEDTGKDDDDGILLFDSPFLLHYLRLPGLTRFADGPFKECPTIFYQLFILHFELSGFTPLTIHDLLTNKTEKNVNKKFRNFETT